MNENPSIEEVFGRYADLTAEPTPVFALLCRTVAGRPELAAPSLASADTPWGRPDSLMAAIAMSLRENPHPLAAHLPTLGGTPGADADIAAAFTDLVTERREELTVLCGKGNARWNDPVGSAVFHAAITRVAAADPRPLALVELGAAAGLVMRPDAYGFDYGRTVIGGDRPLVLPIELRGDVPGHLDTPLNIATRVAVDLAPLDVNDPGDLAWMRASVRWDRADQLERLDLAVPIAGADPPTWAVGDLVDLLPGVLAAVPDGHLPVVYGSNVLCCLDERRERLPEIFAAAGRDLVWISQEGPLNALGLIGSTEGYEKRDSLVTSVTYRAGTIAEATVVARVGWFGEWLHWDPREVTAIS